MHFYVFCFLCILLIPDMLRADTLWWRAWRLRGSNWAPYNLLLLGNKIQLPLVHLFPKLQGKCWLVPGLWEIQNHLTLLLLLFNHWNPRLLAVLTTHYLPKVHLYSCILMNLYVPYVHLYLGVLEIMAPDVIPIWIILVFSFYILIEHPKTLRVLGVAWILGEILWWWVSNTCCGWWLLLFVL